MLYQQQYGNKIRKKIVVKSSKKRSSKFKPLLEAIEKLRPGGQAAEVPYSTDKSVNSMRTFPFINFVVKKIISKEP